LKLTGGAPDPNGYGYEGEYFDKTGNPTKKLLDLLNEFIALKPRPDQIEQQRQKEAAQSLRSILDKRAKDMTPPLPTVDQYKKMLNS
jgi:hypothetical protein